MQSPCGAWIAWRGACGTSSTGPATSEALCIDPIVLDQSIDTGTSAGRFLFQTLAAVGELLVR